MRWDKGRIVFIMALLATAGAFFVAAVLGGRALVISGHVFHNDILFGVDAQRNLKILTEPGLRDVANLERSNVHPLFSPLVKPWGLALQRLGVTPGVSGIIVNAAAGALGLLLAAWYLRRRGLARFDTWALMLLMGASSTWLFMSAIPGTYVFSLTPIILTFILMEWTLARPDGLLAPPARRGREALWLAVGLLNYGITVTNGVMSFLAYGFARGGRRGWARAVAYGAAVLGLGLLAAWAAGSLLNIHAEGRWVTDAKFRGGSPLDMAPVSLVTPTLWSFAAPRPTLTHMPLPGGGERTIAGMLDWNYDATGWALVVVWGLVLGASAWAALAERDPRGRRLSAALTAALAFHIAMHTFYFAGWEGVFFFTPHSLFLVVGLMGPLALWIAAWPAGARRGARTLLVLLALGLAARNLAYLFALPRIVPLP